mmetsp:Transcript_78835/g.200652  ORF Transcript_78835/g.200652 Transcript_78835/m.200652 type:complete len:202 (-) Transcript_78835:477-1082(-)
MPLRPAAPLEGYQSKGMAINRKRSLIFAYRSELPLQGLRPRGPEQHAYREGFQQDVPLSRSYQAAGRSRRRSCRRRRPRRRSPATKLRCADLWPRSAPRRRRVATKATALRQPPSPAYLVVPLQRRPVPLRSAQRGPRTAPPQTRPQIPLPAKTATREADWASWVGSPKRHPVPAAATGRRLPALRRGRAQAPARRRRPWP